jgi:hypothetical protein
MGPDVNAWGVLLGLAAFAGWSLSGFGPSRRRGFELLGAVGFLALFVSIISPDDDLVQQELIRPAAPVVKVSLHSRIMPRRPSTDFAIHGLIRRSPARVPGTGQWLNMDEYVQLEKHFHACILIHSPPGSFSIFA